MIPGETVLTGAPRICSTCGADVLRNPHAYGSGMVAIGTTCDCGPSYSRESDYLPRDSADLVMSILVPAIKRAPDDLLLTVWCSVLDEFNARRM